MRHEYPEEQEAMRATLEMKMKSLLKSGVPTKEIATILGAEEFLHITKSRSQRHSDVTVFDFKAFIAAEIKKAKPIKLPDAIELRPEVFLPPGAGELRTSGEGGGIEEKATIHRTRFLIDLLTSLNLEYTIVQGTNTETMMRGQSYAVFIVSTRKKAVFVNNEEGNATFILHNNNPATNEWEPYSQLTKDQLQEEEHTGRVSRHVWPGNQTAWQSQIADALNLDYKPVARNPRDQTASPVKEQEIDLEPKQSPPDGWVPFYKLAAGAEKSRLWVEKRLPALIASHPEWSGKNFEGFSGVFYPPELLAELRKMATELEKAPEGWLSEKDAIIAIKSNNLLLRATAAQLAENHPEWAPKQFVGKSGMRGTFYPPELVDEIKRIKQEKKEVPHGWRTAKDLSRFVTKNVEWVDVRINKILADHPGWIGREYLDSRGKMRIFYPAELGAELKQMAEAVGKPPAGWLNIVGIAESVQKSPRWVEERIPKLIEQNPDWIGKEYIGRNGKVVMSYPGELVVELDALAKTKQKSPEGWMTTSGIATFTGQTFDRVEKQVAQLAAVRPDWVSSDYLDKGGHAGLDHYSPQLVSEILKMKEAVVIAPTGWLSEAGIAKAINKDASWVKARIPAILSEHPDWANDKFQDRSGLPGIRQYSPKLVELLRSLTRENPSK
ncbi:MAG: hypothetical protein Q7K39_04590 [Candidatus Magasanikbacteria bacterium]|nr:hypothetical protein [Candidatus Magasanikbacteria bacterium]